MSRPHLVPGSSLAVAISVFERSTFELVDTCHREHRAITLFPLRGNRLATLTGNSHTPFDRAPDKTIVPIWQFSAAYSAVTLSSVEDDGLGVELRVLLAHSMRGHHTAKAGGMTRLDPVR